ncbi:hypothetical protein [Nocardia thailandica]|uniref:hypothetical protein n=1 Tax=Nocardia thailandica TaxID=257275 RepID=UPI000308687F|nr:hypothetical protein [Nocardia thailandica]
MARWLTRPGVRIVRADTGYGEPCHGAGRWLAWAQLAEEAAAARPPEVEYADARVS